MALTLVEIGEDERKRALTLSDATFRQTRDAESAAILGWIFYRLGRMEDAERQFTAVANSRQFTPDAVYFYATFSDDRNRGETVKPMLEAALKTESPFAYRAEAQKLYDRLSKKPAARPGRKPVPAADNADADAADEPKADVAKPPVARPGSGKAAAGKAPATKAPATKAPATKPATPNPE